MTETEALPLDDGDEPEADARGAARDSLFLSARVRGLIGGGEEIARVRNLSAKGMMIETDREAAVDARIVVEVKGIGTVGARVAWVREGRMGIELDRVIDPMAARVPVSGVRGPVGGERKPARRN